MARKEGNSGQTVVGSLSRADNSTELEIADPLPFPDAQTNNKQKNKVAVKTKGLSPAAWAYWWLLALLNGWL